MKSPVADVNDITCQVLCCAGLPFHIGFLKDIIHLNRCDQWRVRIEFIGQCAFCLIGLLVAIVKRVGLQNPKNKITTALIQGIRRCHHAAVVRYKGDFTPGTVGFFQFNGKWLREKSWDFASNPRAVEVQIHRARSQGRVRGQVYAAERIRRGTKCARRALGHDEVTQFGGVRIVGCIHKRRVRRVGGIGDVVGVQNQTARRLEQMNGVLHKVSGRVHRLVPRNGGVAGLVYLHALHGRFQLTPARFCRANAEHKKDHIGAHRAQVALVQLYVHVFFHEPMAKLQIKSSLASHL